MHGTGPKVWVWTCWSGRSWRRRIMRRSVEAAADLREPGALVRVHRHAPFGLHPLADVAHVRGDFRIPRLAAEDRPPADLQRGVDLAHHAARARADVLLEVALGAALLAAHVALPDGAAEAGEDEVAHASSSSTGSGGGSALVPAAARPRRHP